MRVTFRAQFSTYIRTYIQTIRASTPGCQYHVVCPVFDSASPKFISQKKIQSNPIRQLADAILLLSW